jgi:hypothetical protein
MPVAACSHEVARSDLGLKEHPFGGALAGASWQAAVRRRWASVVTPASSTRREALAACRAGDTLVVTKLDRLARSLPDARDIVEELTRQEVRLKLGGSVHDPTDPVAGCSSTSWRWSPSSSQTSFARARARA